MIKPPPSKAMQQKLVLRAADGRRAALERYASAEVQAMI